MTTTTTYSPSDGRPADSLPPIRVAIFSKGEPPYIVEIPNPATYFAKHWQSMHPNENHVVRVLPDEPEGGAL